MIPKSQISEASKSYIQAKLKQIEAKNNVRIILAVESGSRAWGFPSSDSDYDVRFIYVRTEHDYLSVKTFRDVIELGSVEDDYLGVPLDLNGWDLRKALELGIKSNPVLLEWIQSPIKYFIEEVVVNGLKGLAIENAKLDLIEYHYNRLAKNSWQQIEKDADFAKCKLYLYALRPALALQWIMLYQEVPPMDIRTLSGKIVKDQDLEKEIINLLSIKARSNEHDSIPRIQLIDNYINCVLAKPLEKPRKITEEEYVFDKANTYFRKVIEAYG